jgi:site-specific DNA-methyltransferase (adenine-specific)
MRLWEAKMTYNKIFNGDCLDLFSNIPDNTIDMCFADPPFNLNKKYNSYHDNMDVKQYLDWCSLWINEMVRVTKPSGSIFLHNIPRWLTHYSQILNEVAFFRHWIAWDAPTAPMGKSLQPGHYGVLFYTKKEKKSKIYELRAPHKRDRKTGRLQKDYGGKKDLLHPFGPLLSDVWTDIHRIRHNSKRDPHPCQLPIHLLERIILLSTDENDVVLDPFLGTGTTALAAKRLGRKYVGFELDEEYAVIATQKLEAENYQSCIGKYWVSVYRDETVTIRDKDWLGLSSFFEIPKPIRNIETIKISLNEKFLHETLNCNC